MLFPPYLLHFTLFWYPLHLFIIITSPSFYTHLSHVPSPFVAMSLVYWIFLHTTTDLKYWSHSDRSQPTSPTPPLQHARVPLLPYLGHTIISSVPPHIPCFLQWQSQVSLSVSCAPYSIFQILPYYPPATPTTVPQWHFPRSSVCAP